MLVLSSRNRLKDITEDEFEPVGEESIVAKASTPTTNENIVSASFTKMQGTKQE